MRRSFTPSISTKPARVKNPGRSRCWTWIAGARWMRKSQAVRWSSSSATRAQASRFSPTFRSRAGSYADALPNLEFAGRTGNGDWADCLAEMDYRTGQILDAIKQAGIKNDTLLVFTSDNGPEATNPWQGDSGPWRGTYFTAMEGSLRAPFIIRWPGKVPAGRVSNEIVHIVDLFSTLARVGRRGDPQGSSD